MVIKNKIKKIIVGFLMSIILFYLIYQIFILKANVEILYVFILGGCGNYLQSYYFKLDNKE